jgi:hypothetical protein
MRKILFVATLFVLLDGSVFAAENKNAMKDLAAREVYHYAESLYVRKDYNEAANAFQKVLALEPGHKGALAYLEHLKVPADVCCAWPAAKVIPARDINPSESNADLKQELAEEDAALDALREELTQMRTQKEGMNNE